VWNDKRHLGGHKNDVAILEEEKTEDRTTSDRGTLHCKKRFSGFPIPSRDVTNQTLPSRESGGVTYQTLQTLPARESLVSDIPAGDGKIANLFLQCIGRWTLPTPF
jgi:hypothetical protein